MNFAGRIRRAVVCVNSDPAEVMAEPLFHKDPGRSFERLTG
jgi:hypothetical protein